MSKEPARASLAAGSFGPVRVGLLALLVLSLDLPQGALGDTVSTVANVQVGARGGLYVGNRAPLQPSPLMRLPPGSVQPQGWLRTMLQTQASGMNGRLEEVSPWLKFDTSDWTTPNGSGATRGWERVPYWLRGYLDLGYCLQDGVVISNATRWIQGVLGSQRTNGYFGPASLYSITNDASFNGAPDMWPHMPMLDALRSYYEFTGDTNALTLMRDYAQWQNGLPASTFGAGYWPKMRMGDNLESVYWLYNRLGEAWLLELAGKMYTNMARWDLPHTLPNWHNVNIAEAFRTPAVYWQQSAVPAHLAFAEANYQTVMGQYGQVPGGAFGADENCRSGYYDPRQGFETCGMVEFMRSFEILTRVTGNPGWADRCEDVALNSFPAALRTNQLSLHYLTAPNQVQLDRFNKSPSVQNGGTMFSYSPFEVYHCCQHNHGQGWPYFCEETWLATWDSGLCASLYGATIVRARVGDASTVTVTETTDYPFGDVVQLSIAATNTVEFPLYLRVPQWCSNAWVAVNGQTVATNATPLSYLRIQRAWTNGDQVALHLPRTVTLRTWTANQNSVTANYGPLSFSLQIGELWQAYGSNPSWPEWEAYPRSAWNYGLSLNTTNPAASFTVVTIPGPLPPYPFSPETAPIRLLAKARQIPEWTLDNLGCVRPLQASPAYTTLAEETVTLVPMGASRLRISAFPTVSTNPAAVAWASGYSPSASYCYSGDNVQALCDGLVPTSSSDTSIPRMTWWNHLGTAEWLRADFGSLRRVSQVSVYWFDDTGFGQCRVPQSWSVEYLVGTNWVAVSGAGAYGLARDTWNTVTFTPVQTTALRLRVQLQAGVSAGVLEWRIPSQPAGTVSSRYPLDGNLNDVENGQNGTLAGGSFVSDRYGSAGSALRFNGTSQYATLPRQIQLNWAIAFWVQTTATGGNGQWWAGKGLMDGEVGGVTDDFGTALVGNRAAFGVGNPDTTILSTTSINDGRWHHVVATRDAFSGQMQLFVDGLLEASTFGPTGAKAAPPNLRLGSLQTGLGFLAGTMDDVRIYDRVLGAWEIAALAGIAPNAPTGLSATATLPGQISLAWLAGAGVTGYNLKRATNSGGPYTTIASPLTAAYMDGAASPGLIYFYVVSAVNGGVESANSAEVSAPLQFAAVAVAGTNVVLSGWGGGAGQSYYVSATTNLSFPSSNWTRVATNSFGPSGSFSVTGSPAVWFPQQFFRIEMTL